MTRFIAILAVLLAFAGLADAACVSVRRVQVIKQEVIAAQVLLPSYQPVYGHPQQQNDDVLRRLLEVLERIEAKLDAGPAGLTSETVIRQNCASCHTGAKAEKGFQLVDDAGQLTLHKLSLRDKEIMKLRVETVDPKLVMPPRGPMAAPRQRALAEALKN